MPGVTVLPQCPCTAPYLATWLTVQISAQSGSPELSQRPLDSLLYLLWSLALLLVFPKVVITTTQPGLVIWSREQPSPHCLPLPADRLLVVVLVACNNNNDDNSSHLLDTCCGPSSELGVLHEQLGLLLLLPQFSLPTAPHPGSGP